MKEGTPERKHESSRDRGQEIELAVVGGIFLAQSGKDQQLAYALARYVVLSRMEAGCRNIDLVTSVTVPGMFMVWEKWASHAHRQTHFEGPAATEMAGAVRDLVREPPQFDIFDAISAHDLV